MDETKNTIVELSYFPCSIIIIGVWNANFREMKELDRDDGVLRNVAGAAGLMTLSSLWSSTMRSNMVITESRFSRKSLDSSANT